MRWYLLAVLFLAAPLEGRVTPVPSRVQYIGPDSLQAIAGCSWSATAYNCDFISLGDYPTLRIDDWIREVLKRDIPNPRYWQVSRRKSWSSNDATYSVCCVGNGSWLFRWSGDSSRGPEAVFQKDSGGALTEFRPFPVHQSYFDPEFLDKAGTDVYSSHYLELDRFEILSEGSAARLLEDFGLTWGQGFAEVRAALADTRFVLTEPRKIFNKQWSLPDWEHQFGAGATTDLSWSTDMNSSIVFYMFLRIDPKELLVAQIHADDGLIRFYAHRKGSITVYQAEEDVRELDSQGLVRELALGGRPIAQGVRWYSNGPPHLQWAKAVDPARFFQTWGRIFPDWKARFERSQRGGGYVFNPDHSWTVDGKKYYVVLNDHWKAENHKRPTWSVFEYGESGLSAVHAYDGLWRRRTFVPPPPPECKLWPTPEIFEKNTDVEFHWQASEPFFSLELFGPIEEVPDLQEPTRASPAERHHLTKPAGKFSRRLWQTSTYVLTIQNENGSSTCSATAKILPPPPWWRVAWEENRQSLSSLLALLGAGAIAFAVAMQSRAGKRKKLAAAAEARRRELPERLSQLDIFLEQDLLDEAEVFLEELLSQYPDERVSILQARQRVLDARQVDGDRKMGQWEGIFDEFSDRVSGNRLQLDPDGKSRPPRG